MGIAAMRQSTGANGSAATMTDTDTTTSEETEMPVLEVETASRRRSPIAQPTVETPHYEGVAEDTLLPARGERVWVDHPIFSQDELLGEGVIASGFDLVMKARNRRGDPDEIEIHSAWLRGVLPIPVKTLDNLLLSRALIAISEGKRYSDLPPVRSADDSDELLFDSVPVFEPADPHYEGCASTAPLPKEGEPVWVDHPQFQRCPMFAKQLHMRRCYAENADERDWLEGRTSIPADTLATLIADRDKAARYAGFRVPPVSKAAPKRTAAKKPPTKKPSAKKSAAKKSPAKKSAARVAA